MKIKFFFRFVIALAILLSISSFAAAEGDDGFRVDNLRSRQNGADYIAVCPPALIKELTPLLEQHKAEGLRVAVVTPARIFKEFDRYPTGPKAMRAFLRFANFHWKPPAPKFILLVGDFDPLAEYNPKGIQMPSFLMKDGSGYYASDNPFADMDDDDIPDAAVGRIPAASAEELKTIVEKTLAFQTDPPPGPWRRRVSVFASSGNFGPFDTTLEELTKHVVRNTLDPKFDMNMTYASPYLPYFLPPEDFGRRVINRFNEGALLFSYIGHGGVTGLSNVCWMYGCGGIMEVDDVPKLAAGGRTPFFFTICCLTGSFQSHMESFAEALLRSPTGPVGVFAASRESGPYSNALISKEMLLSLVKNRPATIGEGIVDIKTGLARRFDDNRKFIDKHYRLLADKEEMLKENSEHLYIYNFLGDPAVRIPYPADGISVGAPTEANAGDKITVSIQSNERSASKLIATLESHPVDIINPITPIGDLNNKKAMETVRKNYEAANNKIAARAETRLGPDGAATVTLKIPKNIPAGMYFIKAYAWDGAPDSFGAAEITINSSTPPPPTVCLERGEGTSTSTKKSPAENVFVSTESELKKILASIKEPKLTREEKAWAEKNKGTDDANENRSQKFKLETETRKADLESRKSALEANAALESPDAALLWDMVDLYHMADNLMTIMELLPKLEKADSSSTGTLRLAYFYDLFNQYDDAFRVLKQAVEQNGEDQNLLSLLAEQYSRRGDFESAEKTLLRAIPLANDEWRASFYSRLAHMMIDVGKKKEAEDYARKAAKTAPADSYIHADMYYLFKYKMNNNEAAEELARWIVDKRLGARWPDSMKELVEIEMERGEKPDVPWAIETAWRYYKITNHKYPKAMAVAFVGSYFERKDEKKARVYMHHAIVISHECHECLTHNWFWFPRDSALERCEWAVKIEPDYVDGYSCLAWNYFSKDNFEKAAEYFEKVKSLGAMDQNHDRNAITTYIKAGRKDLILSLMESPGQSRFPGGYDEAAAMRNRINLYERLGERDKAEEIYKQYVEKWPWSSFIHQERARTLSELGETEKAIEAAKKALEKNPYCRECASMLADLYAKLERWKDAEEAYRTAVRLSPGESRLKLELGKTLVARGDKKEAKKVFTELLNLDPEGYYGRGARSEISKLVEPEFFFD